MDDLFVTTDTIQEAIRTFHDMRFVLSRGGFNLKKWISISPEVLNDIPPNHRDLSPDPSRAKTPKSSRSGLENLHRRTGVSAHQAN